MTARRRAVPTYAQQMVGDIAEWAHQIHVESNLWGSRHCEGFLFGDIGSSNAKSNGKREEQEDADRPKDSVHI